MTTNGAGMFTLTKQFAFEAAHCLPGLPDGHPCKRVHGHSYRVEVVVKAESLDARGFASLDYADLDPFKAYLDSDLDHRFLNDVLPFETTAERIAQHLFGEARKISPTVTAVRVSETAKTWAEYGA